jgi:Transglutaminase-like superfamily
MKPPKPAPRSGSSPVLGILGLLLKALWIAFVVTTPVLGVWVASSLAAYGNGPIGAAVAVGLLLFPGVPLAWELWAGHRRNKSLRGVVKPRFLTFGDRLVLRTLAVNLLFLGVLLARSPAVAFAALSTRGDWMLEGQHGERAEAIRKALFQAADRLEWLYLWVHKNPFEQPDDHGTTPVPSGTGTTPVPPPRPSTEPEKPKPPRADAPRPWPVAAELHHTVTEIPSSSEGSIEMVARYIHDRESEPFRLVKALHDYVADRIAYDAPSYAAHVYPPQDAETVFRTRKAVCAGYALLLTALGKAAGAEIDYVVGDARTEGSDETGEGHAWNAARINGRYYLIDATWDSGSISGTTFKKHYRTEYLFTPPEIIGQTHFPEEARWQLRSPAISRGEFFRQAMMQPSFYAEQRALISPTRSQVTVHGSIDVTMKNPRGLFTLADFTPPGYTGSDGTRCEVKGRDDLRVHCAFPSAGRYTVRLFSNTEEAGTYHFIGQVDANDEH